MLCKRGLCRHAVSVCPSVRLSVSVTFVNSVKKKKNISSFFSQSGSQLVLVFPYQRTWQYSDGNPLTEASNAGGVGRNRDSEPMSGFAACCQRCDRPGVINTRRRITVPQVTNNKTLLDVLSYWSYLTNGYRYGHSYYRRRIGNRTQAFEWHRF